MPKQTLIVAGWRHWPVADRHVIVDALDWYLADIWPRLDGKLIVRHGHCKTGADRMAHEWALACPNAQPEQHPADWEGPCRAECKPGHRQLRYGVSICPAAGPYRNQSMCDLQPRAQFGLIFMGPLPAPGRTSGTADCLRRIQAADIPHRVYAYRPQPNRKVTR